MHKHFDHTHENVFDILTCKDMPATHRKPDVKPVPRKRADYRTERERKEYGRL